MQMTGGRADGPMGGYSFALSDLSVFSVLAVLACGQPRPVAEPAPILAASDIAYSLFLIGDAGGPPDHDQVLRSLERDLGPIKDRSFVVFLGDNVYPRGIPRTEDPQYAEKHERLARQIAAVTNAGARGAMIPGNHDWARSTAPGFEAIVRQGQETNALGRGLVRFLPANGCPGPEVLDEGPFRLILLDTEWLLRDPTMPKGSSACPAGDDSTVMRLLGQHLREAGGRQVIVSGHHPLASGGVHGGHFTVVDHLFPLTNLKSWAWLPLPIIGSLYPWIRGNGASVQDIGHEHNREVREALEAAFRRNPPLVYAAGHEHALQILGGSSARWLVVSGAGYYGHTTHTTWVDSTRYAAAKSGYVRLDATVSGRVRLGVITVDREAAAHEAYSAWIH